MRHSVLISLMKVKGRKSSQGFYYDYTLNIGLHCLESPNYTVCENGSLKYSHSSFMNAHLGKLKKDSAFHLTWDEINCVLRLESTHLSVHDRIVFNGLKPNRGTIEDAAEKLMVQIKNALADRVDIMEAFNKAEFGATIATTKHWPKNSCSPIP
jgi:hypothetical protein